jgi:hypothetical protein
LEGEQAQNASNPNKGRQYGSWFNIAERALAALENGKPAQPVEQIKEPAVVGGDVVALDALRAFRNVGKETTIWPPPGQSKYPT